MDISKYSERIIERIQDEIIKISDARHNPDGSLKPEYVRECREMERKIGYIDWRELIHSEYKGKCI